MTRPVLLLAAALAVVVPSVPARAQAPATVEGSIADADGAPLPGATVRLLVAGRGVAADADGRFRLGGLRPGRDTLVTSFVGLVPDTLALDLAVGREHRVEVLLRPAEAALRTVAVVGRSVVAEVRQSPFSVAAVDARGAAATALAPVDLLDAAPGVHVRRDGGLGSDAAISLNGMSGDQVRLFVDGVPADFYGEAFGLGAVPTALVDRVEVYKGVVPISLGGDALGGAVHLVTHRDERTFATATAGAGSFGERRLALDAAYAPGEWSVGGSAFVNAADNDYAVDVEIPNAVGNPEPARVRRFHDAYGAAGGRLRLAAFDRPWADLLALTVFASGFENELQHGVTMDRPYGAVRFGERVGGATLEAERRGLGGRLDLDALLGLQRRSTRFVDTTLAETNWRGETVLRRPYGGETTFSRNLLDVRATHALGRAGVALHLSDALRLRATVLATHVGRRGEDPVAAEYYGEDLFAQPEWLTRAVSAVAVEADALGGRLASVTAVKRYDAAAVATTRTLRSTPTRLGLGRFGASQALRFFPAPDLLVRASYEYATRFPEPYELFGFFSLVEPNPELVPETSHNANLGVRYDGAGQPGGLTAEAGLFFREARDLIYLRTSPFRSKHLNLLAARVLGVEAEVTGRPAPGVRLALTATYQDLRNRSAPDASGTATDRYVGARLPNVPFLFGHAEAEATVLGLGGRGARTRLWGRAGYVHAFFLNWSIDGLRETKAVVPTQATLDLGVGHTLPGTAVTLSAEVHNATDALVFDNYRVQRPGRSLHLGLRVLLD